MKKLFALMVLLCAVGIKSFAQEQATMPTLIVFPDENWMEMHGYNRHVNVDGETKVIPDYPKAFRMTREIATTCKAVQKTLNDMGFQVEDLQAKPTYISRRIFSSYPWFSNESWKCEVKVIILFYDICIINITKVNLI